MQQRRLLRFAAGLETRKPDQAMVNGLGFRLGEVRVTREGRRVELLPALGAP